MKTKRNAKRNETSGFLEYTCYSLVVVVAIVMVMVMVSESESKMVGSGIV